MRLTKFISISLSLVLCFGMVALFTGNRAEALSANTSSEPTVRVGMYALIGNLDTRRASTEITCSAGFDIGNTDGSVFRKSGSVDSKQLKIKVAGGKINVTDAEGNLIGDYESSYKFAVRGKGGRVLSYPMMHRSGSINNYEYPGFLEFQISDGLLFMVNVLGLEQYTKCVMANEIGGNFTVETRKAFAVLARTMPFCCKHKKLGFDVCSNSACCQVYAGVYRMSQENNEIVEATHGQICAYQGEPIAVLYTGANGGASCSSVAAWGGKEVPYLTSVFLEDEKGEEAARWEKVFTKAEFYEYVQSRAAFSGLSDDEISMQILATDPYGSDYITVLSLSDGSGNVVNVENSEKVRAACGFSSANFKVDYVGDAYMLTENGKIEKCNPSGILTEDGYKEFTGFGDSYVTEFGEEVGAEKIIISGVGSGHGVGFSAPGSEKLAKDGYKYTYILTFFFNGTNIKKLY